ncbi:MAG: hypothetical protein ABIF40_00465 [archaeon]
MTDNLDLKKYGNGKFNNYLMASYSMFFSLGCLWLSVYEHSYLGATVMGGGSLLMGGLAYVNEKRSSLENKVE